MSAAATLAFVVLVFVAVSWLSAYACAAVVSRLRGHGSTRVHATLALAPIALGASVALAILAPDLTLASCHCAGHGTHHPHVCLAHPGSSWPMIASLILVAGWLARATPPLARLARDAVQSARWSRRWTAAAHIDELGVRVVPQLRGGVMTVGIFRPVVVASPSVWSGLSRAERAAIALHERAHALRRDGVTLLVLRFASALLPSAPSQRLVAAWKTSAELSCDRFAAVKTGDPCLVAEALVQCGRLQLSSHGPTPELALSATTNEGDLELRVKALLAMAPSAESTDTGNDALRVGSISLLIGFAFAFASGDATHHAVETLLGWLV